MSTSSRRASIMGALLLGCTPGDPGANDPAAPAVHDPAVVVERDVSVQQLELGPALGGSAVVSAPSPDRYAVAVSFSQHRFVTMEHTVNRSINGSAVLHLAAGGDARACFAASDSEVSDISHYQAHDGQDHHYESDDDDLIGARGSWASVQGTQEIELRLDRLAYRSCEVEDDVAVSAQPLLLRCSGFSSTAKIPSAGLLCRPSPSPSPSPSPDPSPSPNPSPNPAQRVVAKLSLMLGDQARSWALREDLALRDPPTNPDLEPWLLLGKGDGLRLRGQDDREGVKLEVECAKVEKPKPL